MRAIRSFTAAVTLATAIALPAGAALVLVEEAVEAAALEVSVNADGEGQVAGKQCADCEYQRFPVTSETRLFRNGEEVPLPELRKLQGQPATIIYDLKSNKATRIIW